MNDIVELLENLSVLPHQQSIIDSAVDEIFRLRRENNFLWDENSKLKQMQSNSASWHKKESEEIESLREKNKKIMDELDKKSGKLIIAPRNVHGRYPLDTMEIGDGFSVPLNEKYNVRAIIKRHKNKFTTRIIDDHIRVWRVG